MTWFARATLAGLAIVSTAATGAQDLNIPQPVEMLERELGKEPFTIVSAEISRPKARGDITLKAEVAFGDQPAYRVKLRKAEPGAEEFNNRPRYDLAAYELQRLFLDPEEYVVPPTALRMIPLAEFRKYASDVQPTFKGSDDVLCVLQYWLHEVKVIADVYNAERFASDPVYARHIGQLNILTWLIEHGDSNVGNFLISRAEAGARVFSIDNGVAFRLNESDRGQLWMKLRVDRLPADAILRLRSLSRDELQRRLGVLAEWQLQDGHWAPVTPSANLAPGRGVRRSDGTVQLGLDEADFPRSDEIPFDSQRKCMSTLHRTPAGSYVSFTKGAAEVIVTASERQFESNSNGLSKEEHARQTAWNFRKLDKNNNRTLDFSEWRGTPAAEDVLPEDRNNDQALDADEWRANMQEGRAQAETAKQTADSSSSGDKSDENDPSVWLHYLYIY